MKYSILKRGLGYRILKIAGENYKPDDPSTWTGVAWGNQSLRRVKSIDWNNRGLSAPLIPWDLSNFTALSELNCNYNNLYSIDLTGCTALRGLSCVSSTIRYLTINNCTSLEKLNCSGNQLVSLAFSGCTALRELNCSNNQLSLNLAVSNLPGLRKLYCQFNKIIGIKASYCPNLEHLECQGNLIENLEILGCQALREINCENNKIARLNANNCSSLKIIKCSNNGMTELFLSGCLALEELHCNNNKIEGLNLVNCSALKFLDCRQNSLQELDISPCGNIKDLYCAYNNDLTSLNAAGCSRLEIIEGCPCSFENINLSGCRALKQINVGGCPLTELDLGDCESLNSLLCYNTDIAVLDLSPCPDLTNISCSGNKLTELDLSPCSILERLDCRDNLLATLEVSCCPELKELNCCNNQLSVLEVSALAELTLLECEGNQLTDLAVSDCSKLKELHCYDNQLAELDLSGLENLAILLCQNGSLATLDLTGCFALERLSCESNDLTQLLLGDCPALTRLECQNNQLAGLDVSGCEALKYLNCRDNLLGELDLAGCEIIEEVYCRNNELNSLHLSGCHALLKLECNTNRLASLDLGGHTALRELNCWDNRLSLLNLEACSALKDLNCAQNLLTSPDLEDCISLTRLQCQNNELVGLDVSQCSALTRLTCSDNQLASLTAASNNIISEIYCRNNQLAAFDADAYPYLNRFYCENNLLTFATMPLLVLRPYGDYGYIPQKALPLKEEGFIIAASETIDISSQAVIEGAPTTYTWYGEGEEEVEPFVLAEGVFQFGEDLAGQTVYCSMANATFPDFILESQRILVRARPAKPNIIAQPQDTTVAIGDGATFSVEAAAAGDIIYRWQISEDGGTDWSDIEGAGESVYSVAAVSLAEEGNRYRCKLVCREEGIFSHPKISEAATLYVVANPEFTLQPQDITVACGKGASFKAEAEADNDLVYQWQLSKDGGTAWADIAGATEACYATEMLAEADNGNRYRCRANNVRNQVPSQPVYSDEATLTVVANPVITGHPQDITVKIGASADFSIETEAGDALSYQWQLWEKGIGGWHDLEGAQQATYRIEKVAFSDDGKQYRCRVINSKDDVSSSGIYSDVASLTVVGNPSITNQPQDVTAVMWDIVSFEVEAAAADPDAGDTLVYQWQYSTDDGNSWEDIKKDGQEAILYVEVAADSLNGRQYKCLVANTKNGVASDPLASGAATLTVETYAVNFIQPTRFNDENNPVNINSSSLVICEIEGNLDRLGKIRIRIGEEKEQEIKPARTIYYLLPSDLSVGYHKLEVTLISDAGNNVRRQNVRFFWENYRRGFGFGRFDFGEI